MTKDVGCDPWWLEHLACPADRDPLTQAGSELICTHGHRFPIVDGVPVMLLDGVALEMSGTDLSLRRARGEVLDDRAPGLYLETVGISEDEKRGVIALAARKGGVDPVAAYLVAATNGSMYKHLIGTLDEYPIPDLPLPDGGGRTMLDVGCSWGRWSLAGGRKGYAVVGLDPSLGAVMAARRVATSLGLANRYVVGDARRLPFANRSFDVTYSYSVLQHLSKPDATEAIGEMGRVLKPRGIAKVQMPTRFGVRCLYQQARRRFREGTGFEVRYWTQRELRTVFEKQVGSANLEADCYFAIGLQASDRHLMTPALKPVVSVSEWLKSLSHRWPSLVSVADSVFVSAVSDRSSS